MNQRLVRRYGVPVGLLMLGYIPWIYPVWILTTPVASLWMFWLITREPPVEGFREKLPRLAVIAGITALPVAVAAYLIPKSTDVAVIMVPFVFVPALVVLLGGLVAFVRVAVQARKTGEEAGA